MNYLLVTLVGTIALFGVIPAIVIFGLAGRWDVWNVWAYLGIIVVLYSFQTLARYSKNPDLLKERMKPSGRELPGRRLSRIGINVMLFLVYSVAGLDQCYHWSDIVPAAGIAAGLGIVAAGLGLFVLATLVNSFFSSAARVQADRAQQVISADPYAIVRHPGYAGVLLSLVGIGLALNSLLSFIPAVIATAFLARMTILEDRMLQSELAGYADYATKVHYRLIPAVW